MNSTMTPNTAADPPSLQYESATVGPHHRPGWVYAVLALYGIVLAAVVALPAVVVFFDGEFEASAAACGIVSLLVLGQIGLLWTPVATVRRRPVTRRSIWFPIAASGGLLALLGAGVFVATSELLTHDVPLGWYGIGASAAATWLAWGMVFLHLSNRDDPAYLGRRLYRWVLAGSVAELLVAVLMHIICRRRDECCAGMMTGTAICLGVAVMFIAFGPAVLVLYYKRWKKVTVNRQA